ncbi:MAG: MerR family transcriptional regulator [Alphaproteobacteria bacterium]|nr:MerR family transcriptional regulator [Alphaproteobacteria bacterium]
MSSKSADAYRTISEAGEEAGLPPHVLRFWESKFTQIKPVKRAGGRRLYRPHDISLLKGLKHLLYKEGYTIKGAQKYLKDHGVAGVCALADGAQAVEPASEDAGAPDRHETHAGASQPMHLPLAPALAAKPLGMRDDEAWPQALAPARQAGLTPGQQAAARRALDSLRAARARLDQVLSAAD